MQPKSDQEYKELLNNVIKKLITIFGPDITLAKVRTIKGLTLSNDGTVVEVSGSQQDVTSELLGQFKELSESVVKMTIEPLLGQSLNPQTHSFSQVMPASPFASDRPSRDGDQGGPAPPPADNEMQSSKLEVQSIS